MLKRGWLIAAALLLALLASCALADGETEHTHDLYVKERVESTCTRHGWEIKACRGAGCTYTASKNLDIKAHDWELIDDEESTCTVHGWETYKCRSCHAVYTESLELASHRYGSWTVTQEPTCTEKGRRVRYCRECGAKGTGTIARLPHPYGDWYTTREATDRSMGWEEHVCTACGYLESRSFYPAGTLHPDMEKNDAIRALQQYLIDLGILNSRVDGDYGKKTQQAVKDYQQLMGYEPTGIAYPQTLVPLFCTVEDKDGSARMTNTPHVYGDWTILTEATSSAQGLRSHSCLFCSFTCEAAYDPAGTLRPGMEDNEQVKELQRMLIDKKIIKTIADGDYGKKTELGVSTFQQMAGLEVTGVAYPETIEVLRSWGE